MKYTHKMIKIPIELYNSLTQNRNENGDKKFDDPHDPELNPIKLVQKNMVRLVQNAHMPNDVKNIRYGQEFKRAQKFNRDREERPINVRVNNFPEFVSQNAPSSYSSTQRTATSQGTEEDVFEDGPEEAGEFEETYGTPAPGNVNFSEILHYVDVNGEKLGINSKRQVVDRVNGRNHPLKSSDVSKIVRYHLKEGNKGKVPTGYQKFIARCKKDAYLSEVMNCPDSDGDVSGSGKCPPKIGRGIQPINTVCKGRIGKFFPFKPKLWRIIH